MFDPKFSSSLLLDGFIKPSRKVFLMEALGLALISALTASMPELFC